MPFKLDEQRSPRADMTTKDTRSNEGFVVAWLGLCPLLAIATTWRIALLLAACLLVTIVLTAAGLALLRRYVQPALRLPIAALIAGTLVVLLQLAMAAATIGAVQSLDAAVAPWLVLVAGLAVLVCCAEDETLSLRERVREARVRVRIEDGSDSSEPSPLPLSRRERGFVFCNVKLAVTLSAALLLIGVARDAFGRVFLIAATPAGALVLLALLIAAVNAECHPSPQPSPTRGEGEKPGVL